VAVDKARICVVGAGAIGGFIGSRLAAAGYATCALARGATLGALRGHGWRLESAEGSLTAPVHASDDPAELGEQDVVVLAVKAPALASVVGGIGPLLGPDTVVVTAMNGVPWWFFDGFGGEYEGMRLRAVDPDGVIAAAVPADRVIGCVVHVTCSVPEPGLVRHGAGQGFIFGEPGGEASDRVRALAGCFARAGFTATVSTSIRQDIWYKLWGNMTMNPVSVLTGATTDRILDDELVNAFCQSVMTEAAAIGARIGCPIEQSPRDRNAVTRKLGVMKTSMLRDAEAGRPLELDAPLTVAREIGHAVGEPTPHIDILLGLTRLHARTRGLYPP
jgi:2-dehydropantoate 2-reductase